MGESEDNGFSSSEYGTAKDEGRFKYSLVDEFYAERCGRARRRSSFDPSTTGSISLIYSRNREAGDSDSLRI